MKRLLDRDFKYTKAVDTDIRRTFERVRKEREEQKRIEREQAEAKLRGVISMRGKR